EFDESGLARPAAAELTSGSENPVDQAAGRSRGEPLQAEGRLIEKRAIDHVVEIGRRVGGPDEALLLRTHQKGNACCPALAEIALAEGRRGSGKTYAFGDHGELHPTESAVQGRDVGGGMGSHDRNRVPVR